MDRSPSDYKRIFKNCLEEFHKENFQFYVDNWDSMRFVDSYFNKLENGGYELLFDDIPILTFNDKLMSGMQYSEREKKYTDNIVAYASGLVDEISGYLSYQGRYNMGGDHHFGAFEYLCGIEFDLAYMLDKEYDIRPDFRELRAIKQDDGSYMCSCLMNDVLVEIPFVDGKLTSNIAKECIDFVSENISGVEEAIFEKHFHYATYALDWKANKEIAKEQERSLKQKDYDHDERER